MSCRNFNKIKNTFNIEKNEDKKEEKSFKYRYIIKKITKWKFAAMLFVMHVKMHIKRAESFILKG